MSSPSPSAQFLHNRLLLIEPQQREKEIVAIYASLRTVESDCDKAQGTMRTVASAWILATVGGIGLLLQNETAIGPDKAALLRQGLLCAATLGLISLWYIDQRVYQRLLHSAFAAGIWIESQFTAIIPPLRTYMYSRNLEITRHLGWFYRAPILIILSVGILNFIVALLSSNSPILGFVALAAIQFVAVALVLWRERCWPDLDDELPPDRMRDIPRPSALPETPPPIV